MGKSRYKSKTKKHLIKILSLAFTSAGMAQIKNSDDLQCCAMVAEPIKIHFIDDKLRDHYNFDFNRRKRIYSDKTGRKI